MIARTALAKSFGDISRWFWPWRLPGMKNTRYEYGSNLIVQVSWNAIRTLKHIRRGDEKDN
jgi:hypothetical protein